MADNVMRGGEKLQAYLVGLAAKLSSKRRLLVGFPQGSPAYADGMPVAQIAAIHNWGAPAAGIPPRPFFSNWVKDDSPNWGPWLASALRRNNMDLDRAYTEVGLRMQSSLKRAIRTYSAGPPLRPATIKRKGSEKPLVDTAHMLNSVNFVISD